MGQFLRTKRYELLWALVSILFTSSVIVWAKDLKAGLFFGSSIYIFYLVVELYLFYKYKPKYGKNPFK
ncbi:hypothetical protein CTT31_19820 [Pseudoalteromonas maricaloris]|nr:hypothetical protein CTT31_19820 [Pseudoalteromonas flavipulchra]